MTGEIMDEFYDEFKVGDAVRVIAQVSTLANWVGKVIECNRDDGRTCEYLFETFCRRKRGWFAARELELLPNAGTNNPEIPDSSTAANTSEISNSCESAPVVKEYLTTEPPNRVLYLAGPMRGIAFYNFPMFDRVAAALRDVGYEVINPADEDRKEDNFDPTLEPKFANPAYCVVQPGMDFSKIIRRCFEAVMRCDEIVLLPGWENSVGAIAELFIAVWSGKRIQLVYPKENDQMQFVSTPAIDLATAISRIQIASDETKQSEKSDDEDVLDIAARITRGDRQAVYGRPEQDFKKTADMWTGLFQYMLAEDAKFEPRHVAMALICMKMSREFHQRKKDNWVDIAGYARCGSLCE